MKKGNQIAKLYAIITEGFITTLVLGGLGYYIGYKVNPDNIALAGILASAGVIIGIVSFVVLMFKVKTGGEADNGRDA